MLRGTGNDDDLPMSSDIDEDTKDKDLPLDFNDNQGSQISLSDDNNAAT